MDLDSRTPAFEEDSNHPYEHVSFRTAHQMKIYTDFDTFFSLLEWSRRVHLKAHVSRELYKQKQSTAKHNLQ